MRDLSKKQFEARLIKLGFVNSGFLGYWALPAPFAHVSACKLNGGQTRRAQLAYLVNEFDRLQAKEVPHV